MSNPSPPVRSGKVKNGAIGAIIGLAAGLAVPSVMGLALGGGVPVNLRPVTGYVNATRTFDTIEVTFKRSDQGKFGKQKIEYQIVDEDGDRINVDWKDVLIDPPYKLYSTETSLRFDLHFKESYLESLIEDVYIEVNAKAGPTYWSGPSKEDRAMIRLEALGDAE